MYTYPDVVAVCESPIFQDEHEDTLLNPPLIVEVLSPSTEAYDRGKKFEHYRRVESLTEYVLASQDRVHVELYARQESGQWLLTEFESPDDVLTLSSVDCRLSLADIYEKVRFESDE